MVHTIPVITPHVVQKHTQCKVQAQGEMGTQYVDGTNNKTAMQLVDKQLLTMPNHRQMLVEPSSSGTGWTCKSIAHCKMNISICWHSQATQKT